MSLPLLGQLLGLSFAAGLNLYLTVAVLGILSRLDLIVGLPPGLQGLEGGIVIASATALFLIEAVIDKIRHADSLWDTVHTFIRPPAAAFLAVAALWGRPLSLLLAGAAAAFLVALAAHATKAGIRMAINSAMKGGHVRISLGEDALAIAFASAAFLDPQLTLIATGAALAIILLVGPPYWRAFRLGVRCLGAWLRSLFRPSRWLEGDEIPRSVRRHLEPNPLGTAAPRGARAALHGAGVGAYRNGWLVVTDRGVVFVYRTVLGRRRVELPPARAVESDPGLWADVLHVDTDDHGYRLFMLKDGPGPDLAITHLGQPGV